MKMSYIVKHGLKEGYKLPFLELARHNKSLISRIPFRPASATILVTHNCNAKCIMCSMWKKKSTDELTTEEIYDILNQLREIGIWRVGFSGGEALLRTDLPLLIKKARELKFERVTIITNGLLLKKRARELLESGLNEISISLDGAKDIHDMCKGIEGAYRKCIDGLETLADLRDSDYPFLDMTIAMTLMQPTVNQIPHLVSMCNKLKASFMINLFDTRQLFFEGIDPSPFVITNQTELDKAVDELHRIKRKHPSLLTPTHTGLEYAKSYFNDLKRDDIPCVSGHLCIYIDALGNLYSGCWVLPPLGNLRERTIRDIIYSKEYKKRLERMFLKECPGCGCGYQANLYYHLPSLLKGVLWLFPFEKSKTDP